MPTACSSADPRRRALRVADVFKQHGADYLRRHRLPGRLLKVIRHIVQCRTAALGGHLYRCRECGSEVPLYNSCRDRHCPTCQTMAKERWIEARHAELLPVPYFHVVFTLPHALNPLFRANRRLLLGEFFGVVNHTLRLFAADPRWRLKGRLGFLAVLHTWNQLLLEHLHLHCIIPGGVWRAPAKPLDEAGRERSGRWIHARRKFLFRKDSLAKAFRRLFLERLEQLRAQGKLRFQGPAAALAEPPAWDAWLASLRAAGWIVYPKRAFGGPRQVIDYLGRYTHRVAISDHRIRRIESGAVTFAWRNRAQGNRVEEQTVPAGEFIRRFLLHVLPPGFHKIRFFGWMAHHAKAEHLEKIRAALGAEPPPPPEPQTSDERILRLTGVDRSLCPCCGRRALERLGRLPPNRGPP
jgi:hypothetical protein